jgi:hypothetical protein
MSRSGPIDLAFNHNGYPMIAIIGNDKVEELMVGENIVLKNIPFSPARENITLIQKNAPIDLSDKNLDFAVLAAAKKFLADVLVAGLKNEKISPSAQEHLTRVGISAGNIKNEIQNFETRNKLLANIAFELDLFNEMSASASEIQEIINKTEAQIEEHKRG